MSGWLLFIVWFISVCVFSFCRGVIVASGFCNVGMVSPEWQQVSLWFEDYVLFILAKVLLWPLAVFVHLLLLIYILRPQ